ncbi:NAD(P)-dependent oxidoreductase, partial [Brevibacterium paucivorans]
TGAGAHAAATAELAVALVLARLRGLDEAARNQLTGTWDHQRRLSLADRKVTLLGVGGIGEEIRRRLEPFEVEITCVGSRAREDEHGTVYGSDDLAQILPNTEVLI